MLRTAAVLGALIACSSMLEGQAVRVSAGRANWSATGTTVTVGFIVANDGAQAVQVRPRTDLPAEWRLVTRTDAITVGASASALFMVSAMVPVKTPAGPYEIRVNVWATDRDSLLGSDSLRIVVQPRRAIELAMVNHPSFIVSGKSYDADFMVRNRGNVASVVRLAARSGLGRAAIEAGELALAPGESRPVRVHVDHATTGTSAADDVVQLVAAPADDTTTPKRASARVTVVPAATTSIDDYQRIPSQLALRAATSGVSPFVMSGSGSLRDGGSERVDFLFKGKPGPTSAFGERDEYRVDVHSRSWRLRGGDQLFAVSPLTGGSPEGFGIGGEKRVDEFGFGGYAQRSRRSPGHDTETGGFFSVSPAEGVRFALNGVDRLTGSRRGSVGSLSASLERDWLSMNAELARSADSTSGAFARVLHASGERSGVSFDVGHSKGDSAFLGPLRNAEHDYVSVSGSPTGLLSLSASASSHASTYTELFRLASHDRLRLVSAGATVAHLVTLEVAGAAHERRDFLSIAERQTSVRARATPELGQFGATISAELGRSERDGRAARPFSDVAINAGVAGTKASASAFVDRYSGGSVLRGQEAMLSLGGTSSFRVGTALDANVIASANRVSGAQPFWFTNVDAQVSHPLRTGATVSLRARVMHNGMGASLPPVAYLEYSMPLGLPVSRLHTPGRATGRVIDAETGRGIANALVRLGPQVALTDHDGRVAFGGLPAGEHRVSLSQETSYADAVFLGDPVLRVDSLRSSPAEFTLRVARGARVELSARRFAVSRTGIAGAPDSLTDVGPLAGASFRLAGERDTLYRTTDDNGHVSFADVAPGRWVVIADSSDAPAFHRFAPERMELELAGGESRSVAFQLVPRPREVRMMNGPQELRVVRPGSPDARGDAPIAAPRTVKPQVLQPEQRQR